MKEQNADYSEAAEISLCFTCQKKLLDPVKTNNPFSVSFCSEACRRKASDTLQRNRPAKSFRPNIKSENNWDVTPRSSAETNWSTTSRDSYHPPPANGLSPVEELPENASVQALSSPEIDKFWNEVQEFVEDSVESDAPIIREKLSTLVITPEVIDLWHILEEHRKNELERLEMVASAGQPKILNHPKLGEVRQIGKLLISKRICGRGSRGTIIYEGLFEDRRVAVKCLQLDMVSKPGREVDHLRAIDSHPNVIRFFCREQDDKFCYIALELCEATVDDYLTGEYNKSKISQREIMKQALQGLIHLHAHQVVHRDINPGNLLLTHPDQDVVTVKISDFGISYVETSRVSTRWLGTDGFIPQEVERRESLTTASDVFALGCVFSMLESKDHQHAFGDPLRRQHNILDGNLDLSMLQTEDKAMARVVIKAMVSHDPKNRPDARAVLETPLFWDSCMCMDFFEAVSDFLMSHRHNQSSLEVESSRLRVTKGCWRNHVNHELLYSMDNFRRPYGSTTIELLRGIRNMYHHIGDHSLSAQTCLGLTPDLQFGYWTQRFPLLLPCTWLYMYRHRTEEDLSRFYKASFQFPSL